MGNTNDSKNNKSTSNNRISVSNRTAASTGNRSGTVNRAAAGTSNKGGTNNRPGSNNKTVSGNKGTVIKKNKKTNRAAFVKSLMTAFILFAAGFGIVYIILQNTVYKPPEIPKDIPGFVSEHAPDGYHPDDLISNSENDSSGEQEKILRAPANFTESDRKELFYTFLIFGLDTGGNTDTIMVASYDGVNKEGNIIALPRDTMVNVSRNTKKINAAYPAGRLNGRGHDGGVEQLRREIKSIIGFVPDYYICVEFNAFIRMINTLGGVEVDVPFDMYYHDPWQDLTIDIKKGQNVTLNGQDALLFSRYRLGSDDSPTISDYDRIDNQQAVMRAALDKILRPANILKIPEFIDIFTDHVKTDIGMTDVLYFADQLNKISGTDALKTYTLPMLGTSGLPYWYELPDEEEILSLVNSTINPYTKNIEAKDVDIAEY